VTVVKRKQAPRTTMAHKKAAIDAALDVVTGQTPEREPQTAEEARNYVSPHDRLAAALKNAIASHRSARGPTDASAKYDELVAKLELMHVDLSLERPFTKARKNKLRDAMQSTGVTPLPTVAAFEKWLRRCAAE
jgi:hypothetical protein